MPSAIEYRYEDALLETHLRRAMEERPLGHFALKAFDELIGGIHSARFTAICAEPGMAKTTLLGQLADEAAMAGFVNVVNTLEIPAHQWIPKSLSRLSGGVLSVSDVSDPGKAASVAEMAEVYLRFIAPNMVFIERPLTSVELGAVISRIQNERAEPVVLWQDYIQIMPSTFASSNQPIVDERLAVKEAVSGLRRIANTHDVPVFAISSINRASYAKTPGLGALGGSSAVEYSVDTVVHMAVEGASSEEREENMCLPVRPLVLSTLKNRYAAKSVARLSFDCAHATFAERP